MAKELRSFFGRRNRVVIEDFGDSLTVQSDADRTDIRDILQRARRSGGAFAYMTAKQGFYADVSDAPTYMEALNVVRRAGEQFDLLPAEVRDRFNNDPARFLAFCTAVDADGNLLNKDELIKLGLRKADVVPIEPKPVRVEVINPEPPKSS